MRRLLLLLAGAIGLVHPAAASPSAAGPAAANVPVAEAAAEAAGLRAGRVETLLDMMEAQIGVRADQRAEWEAFAEAFRTFAMLPNLHPAGGRADGVAPARGSAPEAFSFADRLASAVPGAPAATALRVSAAALRAVLDADQIARERAFEAELARRAAARG